MEDIQRNLSIEAYGEPFAFTLLLLLVDIPLIAKRSSIQAF